MNLLRERLGAVCLTRQMNARSAEFPGILLSVLSGLGVSTELRVVSAEICKMGCGTPRGSRGTGRFPGAWMLGFGVSRRLRRRVDSGLERARAATHCALFAMINDPTVTPQPHDPANPPPRAGADAFADQMQVFWEKNRFFVFVLIAATLAIILAREGWVAYGAMRERGIQAEYAKLERIDQLPRFAEQHQGHALAGAAWLRVADDAYAKNDFRAAATNYAMAADSLDNVTLKSRARLGTAMSQIAAGDQTAGETALKSLHADEAATATLRAEAAFHLATLAHQDGRDADAAQFLDEVTKIDAMGFWAQRSFALRAQIEAAKPAAPASATPAVEFKPKG